MIKYLEELEERITDLAGRYASLKGEHAGLIKRMVELERENQRFKDGREQARERLDALIKRIDGLEER